MSKLWLAGVLIIVAALAAVGTALVTVAPSRETSGAIETTPPPDPPADGTEGVVVGLFQPTGGLHIFGITLHSPSYAAHIMLVPPPGCVVVDEQGRERVIDSGACSDVAAAGPVTGGGTTAEHLELVIVEVPLSRECYRGLHEGDAWPSELAPCAMR